MLHIRPTKEVTRASVHDILGRPASTLRDYIACSLLVRIFAGFQEHDAAVALVHVLSSDTPSPGLAARWEGVGRAIARGLASLAYCHTGGIPSASILY